MASDLRATSSAFGVARTYGLSPTAMLFTMVSLFRIVVAPENIPPPMVPELPETVELRSVSEPPAL